MAALLKIVMLFLQLAYERAVTGTSLAPTAVPHVISNCSDVLASDATASDGTYVVYWNGNEDTPLLIYCYDMNSGSPREQIELRTYGSVDDDTDESTALDDDAPLGWNYGHRYVDSGGGNSCWQGGSARTYYQRLNVVNMAAFF